MLIQQKKTPPTITSTFKVGVPYMVPLQGGKIHHPLGFFRTAPRRPKVLARRFRLRTCPTSWASVLKVYHHILVRCPCNVLPKLYQRPVRRLFFQGSGPLEVLFPFKPTWSNEQKPWLVGLYRGLYYPVISGIIINHCKDPY